MTERIEKLPIRLFLNPIPFAYALLVEAFFLRLAERIGFLGKEPREAGLLFFNGQPHAQMPALSVFTAANGARIAILPFKFAAATLIPNDNKKNGNEDCKTNEVVVGIHGSSRLVWW